MINNILKCHEHRPTKSKGIPVIVFKIDDNLNDFTLKPLSTENLEHKIQEVRSINK